MATHTTRICARSFLVARNVFHAQENVCSFRGWAHRRPSKVTFPNADPYLTEEKIVDITKEFQNKEYYKTLRRSNKSDGQENVKRNIKSKQPEIPLKDVQNSNLFDYEDIDKQTHNPEKVNKKKISKSDLNQKFERSQKNGLKHEDNFNEENKLKERKKNSDNAAKMKEFLLKQQAPKVVQNLFDSDGRFNFEKLDYGDNKISNLIIKLKSRKSRGRCGQIMVEGWRLIADGLQAGCELDLLLFSRISDLERLRPYLPVLGPRVCKMPYKEIQMWSNLETSPGLIGVFKTPTSKNVSLLNDTLPINLICDNIREPGNLGSILRAALGVGCENIMLTKGCTDIWDSKVLRSAAGAHFRMPIHTELDWNQIEKLIALNTSVFIADNNTNETLMDKFTLTGSKDEQKPLYPLTIPFLPYYSVDFTKLPSITLVIGGEAAGISDDCYRFANERMGVRLNIPTVAGLDSLNSNTALAIIAFEIKRQLLTASAPSHAQNQMTLNV